MIIHENKESNELLVRHTEWDRVKDEPIIKEMKMARQDDMFIYLDMGKINPASKSLDYLFILAHTI